jgi:hypothetical protein
VNGQTKQVTRIKSSNRPSPDKVLVDIAEYVTDYEITSDLAYETARYCLMDALGCAMLALNFDECTKLLGPIVPGTIVPNGSRVPGTDFVLDPVTAAFNLGSMIRWLITTTPSPRMGTSFDNLQRFCLWRIIWVGAGSSRP